MTSNSQLPDDWSSVAARKKDVRQGIDVRKPAPEKSHCDRLNFEASRFMIFIATLRGP